jgi:peptide/nickel transport system ATP-binding protein
MSAPLLELQGISRRFVHRLDLAAKVARLLGANVQEATVQAVDNLNLTVHSGEVVGLVGESGCGKSTVGRIAVGILPQSAGMVRFRGEDTATLRGKAATASALNRQMIFQDPYASLNPRMRIGELIGEAPRVHGVVPAGKLDEFVDSLLAEVGLQPSYKSRYPHQFSGGQRQRIAIARALAVRPEFLVCDEAVASLDVSIQAQVLNLFMDLRERLHLTYLFISHDLSVVEHLSDRVVIMYLGRVVEEAPTGELFAKPNHPYTQGLLAEVPDIRHRKKVFANIRGEIPSPLNPPKGCHFHPRCPHVTDRCRTEVPLLREIAPGRRAACHLNDG